MRAVKIKILFLLIMCILFFRKSSGLEESKNPAQEAMELPGVVYKAEDQRDPFREYLLEEELKPEETVKPVQVPLPALTIQGIIWGGRVPQAIINNKVVKTGDTIEGVRIADISRDGISVFFNEQRYTLSSPSAENLLNLKKE